MFYINSKDIINLSTIILIFNYFNMHNKILNYITRKEYDDLLYPSKKEKLEIQNWLNNISDKHLNIIKKIQNNISNEYYDLNIILWWESEYNNLKYFKRIKKIVEYYGNLELKLKNDAIFIICKLILNSMWDTNTKLGKHMFYYRLKKDNLDKYIK